MKVFLLLYRDVMASVESNRIKHHKSPNIKSNHSSLSSCFD